MHCSALTASIDVTVTAADVQTYSTANVSALLSNAGTWMPTGATDSSNHAVPVANAYYSQITLANGRKGLIFNGWAYDGSSNTVFYPVNAAMLEQDSSGTLQIATTRYLPNSLTNGSSSVLVGDFNGDGKQDIFLAAHNESPPVPKASTAYLSQPDGTFAKVSIGDAVEAHGASLASVDGLLTVFADVYGGDPNPTYQYINGGFVVTDHSNGMPNGTGFNFPTANADTSAVANFSGSSAPDIVLGDVSFGPGYAYQPIPEIAVYRLSDFFNNTGAPETLLTPYFNGKPQYANIPSLNGTFGQSHTYRVWTDDFNHDGKPDIVAGVSLFPSNYSMLQMFQNTGTASNVSFQDVTATLNSDYNVQTAEVDYSMQMLDIDHSGINSYLIAGSLTPATDAVEDNYILLNDGTGRLYVYMHDQFENLGTQVNAYLKTIDSRFIHTPQPRFVEYTSSSGALNLVAEAEFSIFQTNSLAVDTHVFVNLPLQLNPTVDFHQNITIPDRNGSLLIRTWAGDDTIAGGCTSVCSVDGGFGVNTIVYSGPSANYNITKTATGFTVVDSTGKDGTDNIRNIQILKFTDRSVDLRIYP